MSQINVRNLSNENEDGAPDIVGVSTFSATSYIVPPVGTTSQRPENPQPGDLRFNTDTASLEYFRGDTLGWEQIEMTSPDLNGGARGIFIGGGSYPASVYNNISYITISTTGNDTDFGDLSTATTNGAGCASRTRCFQAGGSTPTGINTITYVVFSSTGDGINFGDLIGVKEQSAGLSDATRGIFAGGYDYPAANVNVVEYITMASTGNAADFGDINNQVWGSASLASSTRGIVAGGKTAANSVVNSIDYITIATLGNAADFGDLTGFSGSMNGSGSSNSTRGVLMGGYDHPQKVNTIEYITIATLGDTADFGDMSSACAWGVSVSSPTRGVTQLGDVGGNIVNGIEYVEIMTTGNSKDFGDLTTTRYGQGGSNAHGGL